RGPHDLVAEPVAALDDLEHGTGLGLVVRLRQHRLVDVRIERAVRSDFDEALLLERLPKRPLDQSDTVDESRLLVALGCLERPLEVVEHRQELSYEPLVCVRDQTLLVARRTLAVVLEVGLDALSEGEVLVALGGHALEKIVLGWGGDGVCCRRLRPVALQWLVAHERVASSSSMTSYSASSTTSSSVELPFPDASDVLCAAACA